MQTKKITQIFYLKNGKIVASPENSQIVEDGNLTRKVREYKDAGCDLFIILDLSEHDTEHEININAIKEAITQTDACVYGGGSVKRFEDIKKYLYAGCEKAVANIDIDNISNALEEGGARFGKDKIVAYTNKSVNPAKLSQLLHLISGIIIEEYTHDTIFEQLPLFLKAETFDDFDKKIKSENVCGVFGNETCKLLPDIYTYKLKLLDEGFPMNVIKSSLSWCDLKLNSDGLLPVIVQDYKTMDVLMMAYMNEEAFNTTVKTGKMTYYSRSRQNLWIKGETSGHYQYVRSLSIDCDNDTLLAKVVQIGAACHTGNKSCFYNEIYKANKDNKASNEVLEKVYDVILNRKKHPREGSYTNYLFDKGIDKILKKVGEECTEIVIAAKNPDSEEIKYEISDFLYHTMVLMVEKGVSWNEIYEELARRE
ncbi:phosphoribosyl-ATP pyrophosphatase /phosphoribosyl-AMP cyclohydrolase [Acetitomaculum ruminis DSM 5522]|uniref:Histidine biosynthesis bifunctional protein HisIE n=1 Tax=Acetitomaculum ruminis DSM 5522 TaxID=1120918 RepID=A0A1I0V9V6_9FIRM|nr:bifunctional phosphoribosyl-AMP cyclohydrolase/phosphoribosyl-ATP diphosphatase HisIE [Acetitomaculum ruminis]SFA73105.1 phosphoribosyl-ATP pyrophosphatase /phosphoribosyl-AMP cyclohydrolase [Acetitomaculum ruminis DSM 5522]